MKFRLLKCEGICEFLEKELLKRICELKIWIPRYMLFIYRSGLQFIIVRNLTRMGEEKWQKLFKLYHFMGRDEHKAYGWNFIGFRYVVSFMGVRIGQKCLRLGSSGCDDIDSLSYTQKIQICRSYEFMWSETSLPNVASWNLIWL